MITKIQTKSVVYNLYVSKYPQSEKKIGVPRRRSYKLLQTEDMLFFDFKNVFMEVEAIVLHGNFKTLKSLT